ncbi:MAG: site-specific DNA-methyltransferase [Planctomycetota bacterium]
MTDQPETLDLRSQDIAEDNRQELLRLFPEVRTEGGKIDFERLKLALGEAVDVGKERYGMNWPGKAECFKTIQMPSLGTLRPCREESVNFDSTENLIVEGDNLEVLKLLQKSYLGTVKMIYIDPPYNTGNDFIYPDNYTESLQTYLEYTGQVDAEGRKFGTNTDADGRFHSKWLNMMYPRLYLARNLLREDGVLFITIDDTEVASLRHIANDIFGEENFVANVVWQKKYAVSSDTKGIPPLHDHILVFQKSSAFTPRLLPRTEKQDAIYKSLDNDPRGLWRPDNLTRNEFRERDCYPITSPKTGKVFYPPKGSSWRHPREEVERMIADNRIWFGIDGNSRPAPKRFLSEVRQGIVGSAWWPFSEVGHNDESKKELQKLFDEESPFDTPKPVRLVRRMLELTSTPDSLDIILDFFAGSGTTAHAVLDQNKQDGGNRKFILVQLPEPTGGKDYPTIADITKERVRRAIKGLNDEDKEKLNLSGSEKLDRGFRVFKLDQSNFTTWDAGIKHDPDILERQLELHVDHIRDERTPDDLLYELLLKSGFPLTTPVEKLQIARGDAETQRNKKSASSAPPREPFIVYSVAGGVLMICLEPELTLDLIRAMAEKKPERIVCLDEGFAGNDQLKANAVQIFKTKGVTSFKTV